MTANCVKLSVVIVSYNTCRMTLDCLRTLTDQLAEMPAECADGGDWAEIWVVDNGSRDGSAEAIARDYPHVKLIANERNLGFGPANNQALRQAGGETVLLLNSDAFPRPGAISALLACLCARPDAAVVGPRLLNADGTLQMSCYRFPGPWRTLCESLLLTARWPDHPRIGDYRAWPHDAEREVEFVIGACIMARRAALEQIGCFDEAFFLYAEETDLCRRLRTAGWRVVFTPTAEVVHLNGGSGKRQPDRVFCEFRRGQERFIRKHHGICGLWFYRLMVCAGALLRVGIFGAAALVRPGQRSDRLRQVAEWRRILVWTIGLRGPGLREP